MSQIDATVIERIEQMADRLYAELERERFPTVDAVRRAARVDMNAASVVMKGWRRKQTAKAEITTQDVPEALQAVFVKTVGEVWGYAQTLANESLRAAQAQWDVERQESEALRSELSSAFDALNEKVEVFNVEKTEWMKQREAYISRIEHQEAEYEQLRQELAKLKEVLAEKNGELNAYKSQLPAKMKKSQ